MYVSPAHLVIYGGVGLLTSVLSGISGGGAGFINTPLMILLGLSPAQAVATGKVTGLSVSVGSLGGLKGGRTTSWRQIGIIMALALVVGLIAPHVITQLDTGLYRHILGILILCMVPIIIWKKVGHVVHETSPTKKAIGYVLLVLALLLQGIFSGGMGTLVNVVLIAFLGLTSLDANISKRYSQLILNSAILIGVLWTHLIVWQLAAVGIVTALIGGFIGGKIALKHGSVFVMAVLIGLMILSGLWLVFT